MTKLEKAVLDRYRDFRIALENLCLSRYADKNLASTVSAGLMSSQDKTKLDSLRKIVAGFGLSFADDNILNVTLKPYELPTAGTSTLGGICIGDGLVLNVDTVSVDHNIFAPLITSFALSAGDWTLDGNESTAYSYVANVAVSGLSATDYAVVDFNRGSQDLAVDAEICPTAETQAEVVKLFAQNIPSGELTGQVTVWKR